MERAPFSDKKRGVGARSKNSEVPNALEIFNNQYPNNSLDSSILTYFDFKYQKIVNKIKPFDENDHLKTCESTFKVFLRPKNNRLSAGYLQDIFTSKTSVLTL